MKKTIILLSFLILTISINAQSVKIESLKLNNKISYIIDFDELKMTYKIDSITPNPELMDMSVADSLIYLGQTYFEYYEKTNKCHLGSVILDEKIKTLSVNSYTFDKNTTLDDIKQKFPTDCSSISKINIFGDDTDYLTCSIGMIYNNGEKSDNRLLFFFSNNKLRRIDFWEPS